MKSTVLLARLSVILLLLSSSLFASAQTCTGATIPSCDVADAGDVNGFVPSAELPCVVQGQATEIAIPFKVFATINGDSVYRMRIESIGNVPCGLCWKSSNSGNVFMKDEAGCFVVRGTTTEAAGQYALNIVLSFDTANSGSFNVSNVQLSSMVSAADLVYVRLVNENSECAPVNLNGSGLNSNCQ